MGKGKIITFYSYKGGTGRSMALANVAWLLALDGRKVLAIDWDLEAPGLHRYFLPFLDDPELVETQGLIELFWSYADLVLTPKESWPPGIEDPLAFANAQRHAVPLEFPFPDPKSCLHFLGAGRQEAAYATRVRNFDWSAFYARLDGQGFIEKLSERFREQYDYVLVDSRTGVADTSGICTMQIPDTVVLCFTYNRQSMRGVEAVGKSIRAQRKSSVRLLPVAMRVEKNVEGYDKVKQVAREMLDPLLLVQFNRPSLERYWKGCEVPHYPHYSFEETLAFFKDTPGERNTLLSDMVWLAEAIDEGVAGSLKIPHLDQQILETYAQRFELRVSSGSRPLNEAKLILVGRGAVGKTSLVNRLLFEEFKPSEGKTEGIQISEWSLRLNDDEDVRLNIWDFGGQEIMHATHQFFLTERSLYLLVLNGREGGEDADADYWLKLIDSFGGESPIIVVLNKIKEHPFDVNRRALQQKYPAIRDFIKTDCSDGTGLKELRKAIERETDRLTHLRDAFPANWFAIKDRLASTKKNFLNFEEYRSICSKYGEADLKGQELLALYLHNLGIILNYKDDARLQDTHVLNPHWVTDGIYKVLNSEKLEKQKGEIRLDDLSKVLDARNYPVSMRRFIFDLMKKFDLCFSFPDDDTHYLIPELLDKQEPSETAEFVPEECLNFQYHYPVLPEGLLPRFIARTHVLSEGSPRWRTGVILRLEDSRALVRADVHERRVFINVSGPSPAGRRRLLAVIRSDFERIHRDIHKLRPQEMVPLPGYPEVHVPYQELLVMEESGIGTMPKVVNDKVVDLNVNELLSGIDLEGTRRRKTWSLAESKPGVRLFYSYSHKDERLRNELETHLKLLQRRGLIESWYDRNIETGDDWQRRVDDNVERADVILLLVSADFMASDYCYGMEMMRALVRHENREAWMIPVIVRDVDWHNAPFAKLQVLPKDALAVTKWPDKDSAWRNVSEGIEKIIGQIRRAGRRAR